MSPWFCTSVFVALGFGFIVAACVVHEVRMRRRRAWVDELLRKDRP